MEDKLTLQDIEEVFGKEVDSHTITDGVFHFFRVQGTYILVWKEYQSTISIFEDDIEFTCVCRDYWVDTKERLKKVLFNFNIVVHRVGNPKAC